MFRAIIIDNSGRHLFGQTIAAFFVEVKHAKPFTVGVTAVLVLSNE